VACHWVANPLLNTGQSDYRISYIGLHWGHWTT